MRLVLVLLSLAACHKQDAPVNRKPADPESVEVAAGPPDRPPTQTAERIDAIVTDTIAYTEKMMPMFASFDGDCNRFAETMLGLEPLATSVRAKMKELVAAGADAREVAEEIDRRIKSQKEQVMPRIEAALARTGKTLKDFEVAAQQIETACAGDPKYADAKERVGLFKKRAAPAQPR
jgi:hypothetical protein